jgi:AcrR family transcriptional regulator
MAAMSDVFSRLPRGRHGLSREEVEDSQRLRMLLAMVDATGRKGFVATSVADVLKGAGVSRETFYQQFSSKLDCFLAAFDAAGEILVATLDLALGDPGEPLERFDRVLRAYLDQLAEQSAVSRMFLVEVFAAGPEAIERRARFQARIVDTMVELLELPPSQRFACELVVAGIGALVTVPLVADDLDGVRALHDPIVDLVAALLRVADA